MRSLSILIVLIAKAGKPLARLVPYMEDRNDRTPGLDRDLFEVPDDFDAPLPDKVIEEFES